jgi:alpha-N-acetylglucosamine transferase
MSDQNPILPESTLILFEELQQECLTAIRYIEALKVKELSDEQKEDILGELSASITHLRIQSEELDRRLEDI